MSETKQTKVLRIGIILDGKLVQEKLIDAGQPVTVGESEKCDFVFPKTELPSSEFTIFAFEDGHYQMRFTDTVKGKIRSSGAQVSLDKARKDDQLLESQGVWKLPLTDDDRGKVRIGAVTVLFQFVTPPPVAATTALDSADFRPRLIGDDDPLFLGILAVFMALGTLFSVYVYNADRVELAPEDIPERFQRLVIVAPPPDDTPEIEEEEEEEDVEPDELAVETRVETREAKPSEVQQQAPKTEVEKAQEKEAAKDDIAKSSQLFQQLRLKSIGTIGEHGEGQVLLENAGSDFSDIDAKLREAQAKGAAIDTTGRIRGGQGVVGGTGDRTIGELEAGEDIGNVDVGAAPQVKVEPRVDAGDLEFDGGDVKGLGRIVRRYQGQLKYCYEKSLKANPSLRGRVVLGWTIEGEKALDVYVAENSTGDSSFAKCLRDKVGRWAFTGIEDGDAKQPFVFQPEG